LEEQGYSPDCLDFYGNPGFYYNGIRYPIYKLVVEPAGNGFTMIFVDGTEYPVKVYMDNIDSVVDLLKDNCMITRDLPELPTKGVFDDGIMN